MVQALTNGEEILRSVHALLPLVLHLLHINQVHKSVWALRNDRPTIDKR